MHGRSAGPLSGETILDADPRFRFAWHRPPSGGSGRPLLVAVHGSDRDYRGTLAAFASLADRRDFSILAPLFPVGAVNRGVDGGYKFLREPGADYVSLLDAMLASFSKAASFDAQQLYLFGFSGGGQFALRYGLVAASQLAGLIIAAPGNVTLLDDALPWWAGTRGIDRALGRPLDRSGLRDLPVHLIVGADDLTDGVVERGPDDPYYSPHAGLAGPTRRARIAALQRSLEAAGVRTTLDILDGVAHDFEPIGRAASACLDRMFQRTG